MSRWSSVLWPPPTSHPASSWISPLRLIPFVTLAVGHRPDETSPVSSPTFTTSRSPYAGGFFAVAFSGSSPLPWPSLVCEQLGSLLPCFQVRSRRCKIHFMLRTVVLPPFLGDTSLQHLRSPRSTGCLLRGHLTATTTGLPPVSKR